MKNVKNPSYTGNTIQITSQGKEVPCLKEPLQSQAQKQRKLFRHIRESFNNNMLSNYIEQVLDTC